MHACLIISNRYDRIAGMKKLKVYQWIIIVLAIIVNVFIIVSSCLPADPSTEESGWIINLAKSFINFFKADTINESNIGPFSSFIRKFVGHFSLFAVSSIFTTLSIKFIYYDNRKRFWIFVLYSAIFGLSLALLTELIQLFVPGRSGEIRDVLIDFSGYLLALIIIGLIIFLKNKKISNVENEDKKG